jgi:DNA-binding transcriptional MerR regulator
MNESSAYRLQELAEAFEITERSARHYIGTLLPSRLRAGRGKRARYGQETWNCFAFIQKARERKFTHEQIAGMLERFSQKQVDSVAHGLDDLAIVPVPAETPGEVLSSPCVAAEFEQQPSSRCSRPRWQMLHADGQLQIMHQGTADPGQREQARLIAILLKHILGH